MLAAYLAVHHFTYFLEGRPFTLYTDHKPLVGAISRKKTPLSNRQVRHLSFISEFTTDVRHIEEKNNVVADRNRRHADWGYDDNSPDGECLAGWASINCLALLYNAKDAASFYTGRWNTGTNPEVAFASVGLNSRLPDRRVLEKFPRSQH